VVLSGESPVKAPRALAALSLCLVSFAVAEGPSHEVLPARKATGLRAVEPRLTGAAEYAPCGTHREIQSLVPAALCEPQEPARKASRVPSAVAGVVRGRAAPPASEDSDGGTDLGHLLSGGSLRDLNRRIRRLERAGATDPHNGRNWSDLAAVYLVRAQRADDPEDLLWAYGAAERAVQEDGALPEARFNRALALERLFLTPAAASAWREYLNLDGTSGWAAEAREHLTALKQPTARNEWDQQKPRLEAAVLAGRAQEAEAIVDRHRLAAREFAEQELFGQWADAVVLGQEAVARDRLHILRTIGDALARLEGERLIHDAVAVIDGAAGDPDRWRSLAQAHRSFRDGYLAYNVRSCKLAIDRLSVAKEALGRAGSPLAIRAEILLVGCDYLLQRYPRALVAARRLAHETEKLSYPCLRAYLWRVKAVVEVTMGKLMPAIEDYTSAVSDFRRLGEVESIASAEGLLGENLTFLGRGREAWQSIYRALRATSRLRDPGTLANIFMIAGDAALRDGAAPAALAFEKERVHHALGGTPLAAVEALTWLARMQDHMGDHRNAQSTLLDAERRSEQLLPEQRVRTRADLEMIEGTLSLTDDPVRAGDLLTAALGVYQQENNLIFSLWTLLARGRVYRRSGNDVEAERDFAAALDLYDRMGDELKEENRRLSLLEETDAVFDEMVSLQAGHDPDRAFAFADRARTRILPGSASKLWTDDASERRRLLAVEPQPLPLTEIRREMPSGVTLVQFSVIADQVLIWRISRDGGGPEFFVREFPRNELNLAVARLQRLDRAGWEAAAEELYDQLIRPWLSAVPRGETIVFVPDKVLHRVPFAALKDRATGRLLIESHPLAVTPSATLYVNALQRQAMKKPGAPGPGLVIGAPAIDQGRFADLPLLPDSEAEARLVASRTGAQLLVGKAAGKSAVLAAARQADWIHFSGHALVDSRNTLLSKLVLAPEAKNDPGILTAQEIYSLKLDHTRLVILAACETANEYIPGSEGVTSLARAFLAAGVPTVVASLWSVDDRSTADLFDAFHQRLSAGEDPVEALRNAQLAMLHGSKAADRPPRAWAAFEVIGASAQSSVQ
jgi:CHAT domain-containing protein